MSSIDSSSQTEPPALQTSDPTVHDPKRNDVTRELGTSLGVALLSAVFAAGYSSAIAPLLSGFPEDAAAAASQNIANAMVIVDQGFPYADALYKTAQEAFVQGWQQAMWAGVAVMAILLLFVALLGPARPTFKAAA